MPTATRKTQKIALSFTTSSFFVTRYPACAPKKLATINAAAIPKWRLERGCASSRIVALVVDAATNTKEFATAIGSVIPNA